MGLRDRLFGKKTADPAERRRRLLATGRITDGTILDTRFDADGTELVVFVYTLNGVDFESADILTDSQKQNADRYAPGAKIGVRFDPKNQYDSVME